MTTVLCTNAYKAASTANKARQAVKSLPVSSTLLLHHHDGRLLVTPFRWDEHAKYTEAIAARIDGDEWAACVPAKPFIDWLRVTQTKQAKHAIGRSDDQINMTLDGQTLRIRAGNTRAEFKCMSAGTFPK